MRLMGDSETSRVETVCKAYASGQVLLQLLRDQVVADTDYDPGSSLASHEWDFSVQFWDAELQAATDAQGLLKQI